MAKTDTATIGNTLQYGSYTEAFEKTRFSFVFDNKDVFEGFFKYLEGVKVNNSFSLILVDIKEQRVVEERFIPRHDGKEQKSFFIIKKDSRE